jgi:hypothetical protein
MKNHLKTSFWLMLCLATLPGWAQSDFPTTWRTELQGGILLPVLTSQGVGFHLTGLLPAHKLTDRHRISVDFQRDAYPMQIVLMNQGDFAVQDSGAIYSLGLSYGREARKFLGEQVMLTLGAEGGIGYSRSFRTTRNWLDGDLSGPPAIARSVTDQWLALLSGFTGITVWIAKDVGLTGQGWLRTRFSTESAQNTRTFGLDQQLSLRMGLVYRWL